MLFYRLGVFLGGVQNSFDLFLKKFPSLSACLFLNCVALSDTNDNSLLEYNMNDLMKERGDADPPFP